MDCDILVQNETWHTALPEVEEWVRGVSYALFSRPEIAARFPKRVEVSFVLGDDAFIQNLNATYRGKDKPTNVLSFPALSLVPDMETIALGDVVIALETVETEAKAHSIPVKDHIAHLVVHGILHLLGYDHEEDNDAERMEALEIAILRDLSIKNPYETL